MTWTCFWLEPTNRERRYLRRFTWSEQGQCPAHPNQGHDAKARIEDAPIKPSPKDPIYDTLIARIGDEWGHDDSRWPTHCDCGYAFQESDRWQLFEETIYRRVDTGDEMTIREAPIGAMYDAPWLHDMHGYRVVDGKSLLVKLPGGGEWAIDGESRTGGYWDRKGTPPKITARPSILTPRYHGWLTDGVFTDDLEGRTYG